MVLDSYRLARWYHQSPEVFLAAASYLIHPFWNFEGDTRENELIHFLKNLALMGAMVMVLILIAVLGAVGEYLSCRDPGPADGASVYFCRSGQRCSADRIDGQRAL